MFSITSLFRYFANIKVNFQHKTKINVCLQLIKSILIRHSCIAKHQQWKEQNKRLRKVLCRKNHVELLSAITKNIKERDRSLCLWLLTLTIWSSLKASSNKLEFISLKYIQRWNMHYLTNLFSVLRDRRARAIKTGKCGTIHTARQTNNPILSVFSSKLQWCKIGINSHLRSWEHIHPWN